MEKFDQRLEATRKLVETGMKLLVRMDRRIDALTRNVDKLTRNVSDMAKTQELMLKLLRGGGGNGHGRLPH